MSITRTPSHQPMATYQYTPVDDRTIRLVTLLPGTPADTLSVHLHAHSLDDAAALPDYEALSDAFWAVRKAETAYQGYDDLLEAFTRLWFGHQFRDRTVPAARDTGDDMVFDEARAFIQATFDEDRGTSRTMNAVEARCLTAYVDGFMNGEGIFGPLPAGWTAVWRDSPDASEVVPAFLQDVESVPTWDDPRLFARGFLSEKMKESATWKEALERRMTLTPDVLSSKGVPLVDIDLV
ncbi:hypothetical protein VdG1_08770 [Verticillium dahliae VDG1]|nr:hypothetical protein VdG1_08770 [Verticillium dahliae VDG1]